jgi:hypothetical protein
LRYALVSGATDNRFIGGSRATRGRGALEPRADITIWSAIADLGGLQEADAWVVAADIAEPYASGGLITDRATFSKARSYLVRKVAARKVSVAGDSVGTKLSAVTDG